MRQKRAKFGDAREVYFAQEHPPGRQRISNFIDTDEMKRLPDFLVSVQQALGND